MTIGSGWTALAHVAWSADREAVFVVGFSENGPRLNNMALLRVDLDGRVRVLRHHVNQWHVFPVAAPDGSRLGFGMMILALGPAEAGRYGHLPTDRSVRL